MDYLFDTINLSSETIDLFQDTYTTLQQKFDNLLIFYKKALPQAGWGTYKAINIKYANQVIGVKNQLTKQDSLKAVSKRDSIITASIKGDSAKTTKDTSQIKY